MENEREIYFSSDTKIDWDTHKELYYVKYKAANLVFWIWIVLISVCTVGLFFLKTLSYEICILFFIMCFIMVVINSTLKKYPEIMQGRQRVKYGKDIIENHVEFSDKIYLSSSDDIDRSFDYALVERMYETDNNYFLILPYGVTIIVCKRTLVAHKNLQFRMFIFEKCYSVKEPVFIKLKDGSKTSKRLIITAFLISIVALMLCFFLKNPENWRELGRNPQYSSSQQSTNSSSNTSK